MFDAISNGIGVGFVKESTARRIQVKGIVFRELKDARVMVEFGVIYRSDKSSQALRVFLQVLANMADSNGKSSSDLQPG